MADLDALHDAVVAAPLDDGPRVAYADAVAGIDPDLAEFIRLQLALSRWRRAYDDPPERLDASIRSQILLDRHRASWEARVRRLVTATAFIRGFVEYVEIDAARFLATAPELYRQAPILHLVLNGVKPVAAELFASPSLGRIESLGLLRNDLGDAEARLIAASPYLARLAWLDLGLNSISAEGLEALAASDALPRLGYLGLSSNLVEDPTPRHADGYDRTSPAAQALQDRYGPREWLDAHVRAAWPPDRDAAE